MFPLNISESDVKALPKNNFDSIKILACNELMELFNKSSTNSTIEIVIPPY